jgi:hypothetical protein
MYPGHGVVVLVHVCSSKVNLHSSSLAQREAVILQTVIWFRLSHTFNVILYCCKLRYQPYPSWTLMCTCRCRTSSPTIHEELDDFTLLDAILALASRICSSHTPQIKSPASPIYSFSCASFFTYLHAALPAHNADLWRTLARKIQTALRPSTASHQIQAPVQVYSVLCRGCLLHMGPQLIMGRFMLSSG